MATAQTYRRQFKKTFKIVDEVATEYYDLLEKEKIQEDDNFICTYSDLEKIDSTDFIWLENKDKDIETNNKSIRRYQELIDILKEDLRLENNQINKIKYTNVPNGIKENKFFQSKIRAIRKNKNWEYFPQ